MLKQFKQKINVRNIECATTNPTTSKCLAMIPQPWWNSSDQKRSHHFANWFNGGWRGHLAWMRNIPATFGHNTKKLSTLWYASNKTKQRYEYFHRKKNANERIEIASFVFGGDAGDKRRDVERPFAERVSKEERNFRFHFRCGYPQRFGCTRREAFQPQGLTGIRTALTFYAFVEVNTFNFFKSFVGCHYDHILSRRTAFQSAPSAFEHPNGHRFANY